MTPVAFGAHGHVFAVDTDEPALGVQIATALATLRVADSAPSSTYRVQRDNDGDLALSFDGDPIGRRSSADAVILLLHWHINQRVVDAASARRTTFHAAAARSPNGTGILLPAPMESGKTTTVTGLIRAGWDYLTDEAAAVDPDGEVWAYPKPLTIDQGSWSLFPDLCPPDASASASSWLVPASAAGAAVAECATVRLVVFPQFRSGARTGLTRLRPSEAALELAHSTFHLDRHGARDLRCVGVLARTVPAFRLTIGDLSEAVAAIERLEAELAAAA